MVQWQVSIQGDSYSSIKLKCFVWNGYIKSKKNCCWIHAQSVKWFNLGEGEMWMFVDSKSVFWIETIQCFAAAETDDRYLSGLVLRTARPGASSNRKRFSDRPCQCRWTSQSISESKHSRLGCRLEWLLKAYLSD